MAALTTRPTAGAAPAAATSAATAAGDLHRVGSRRFVQLLAAGAAGMALAAARHRSAAADYINGPGSSPDTVTTDLTVQGNLTTNGKASVGTTNQAYGRLTVADDGTATGDFRATSRILQTRTTGSASTRLRLEDAGNRVAWELATDAFQNGTRTLYFYDVPAVTYRLLIDSVGNVGIGTTIPVARLDVRGTIRYESPISGYGGLIDNDLHAIRSNGLGAQVFANAWGIPTQGWNFRDEVNSVERVTIQCAGNVGIGMPNPEARLHLGDGALKIGARVIADGSGAYYAP